MARGHEKAPGVGRGPWRAGGWICGRDAGGRTAVGQAPALMPARHHRCAKRGLRASVGIPHPSPSAGSQRPAVRNAAPVRCRENGKPALGVAKDRGRAPHYTRIQPRTWQNPAGNLESGGRKARPVFLATGRAAPGNQPREIAKPWLESGRRVTRSSRARGQSQHRGRRQTSRHRTPTRRDRWCSPSG